MRTPEEQLERVRHRLLMAHPEFRSLHARTGIADGILMDMVTHFTDAPEGPFIRILTLWTRWKQDAALGSGDYDTFVFYVAKQEERDKATRRTRG